MAITTYLQKMTLNVNALNLPIKRHRVTEWIKNQNLYMCCLSETWLRLKDTYRLKVNEWKKIFYVTRNEKKKRCGINTCIRQNRL